MLIPGAQLRGDPATTYLRVRLICRDGERSENRLFFAEPKHLALPAPRIYTRLIRKGPSRYILVLRSNVFVKNLRVELPDNAAELEDNFFDLDPREVRRVTLEVTEGKRLRTGNLVLKWLK
jgi:hypothetical protein